MRNINLLKIILLLLIESCVNETKNIDSLISKFDKTDFSKLKGKSIYIRSKDFKSITYFVNTFDGSCGPYVVEFSLIDDKIVSVRNNLVIASCGRDFLNKTEIYQIVEIFAQYKLALLQVDDNNNVYINTLSGRPANLLRKTPGKSCKIINLFKLYQGNWYTRK